MDHLALVLLEVMIAIAFYSIRLTLAISCIPTNYVRFRDRLAEGASGAAQVPHPGQFLANAYVFGCHGVVTQWEAYTFNSGAHPIEFHVWRANDTMADIYHLVGINTFQNVQPDANRLISLTVPLEDQITVSPGDFAGIRTIESQQADAGEGFRIQFDNGGTYREYRPPSSIVNYSTPSLLDLVFRPVGGFSSFSFIRSPIMRATVAELGSDIPTTTASTATAQGTTEPAVPETMPSPQPTTPLPLSAIIAIAVSAGVLILTVFIVIITLVCCCLLCKRNRKLAATHSHPTANGHQHNDRIQNNPAYNRSDNFQLVNNTSYNHRTDNSQLVNNPAYNANGNDEPYYSVIRD